MAKPTLPIVDLSPFFSPKATLADRRTAASALAVAGHSNGFIGIRGHDVPLEVIAEAFVLNKTLFDLPREQKMRAPHPKGPKPHRGWSAPGNEQAFTKEDLEKTDGGAEKGALMATSDLKESFEVGDDLNDYDTNIWLPEDAFPGFRERSTALFNRFRDLSYVILDALMLSLDFEEEEATTVRDWHKPPAGQLRFLHYLPVELSKLGTTEKARLPAHTDWNSITLSFQDTVGGLEYQDRESGGFIAATAEPDLLYLNIGDMFERISNGYYPPGIHRVVLPEVLAPETSSLDRMPAMPGSIPDRYSVIFFLPVSEQAVVSPPPSRVQKSGGEAKFESIKFLDYTEAKAKWHFAQYAKEDPKSE